MVYRHGLRSALVPVVTIFGIDLGLLLAGTLFTERIFEIQGIGLWGLRGVYALDLPVVSATALFTAIIMVSCNLIVDIVYSALDPRVRLLVTATPLSSTSVERSGTTVSDSDPYLVVEDLSVEFPTPDGPLRAVNGVSYSLSLGKTLGIVGESGSGKSVSSMAVLGLHDPQRSKVAGSIRVGGQEIVGLAEPAMRKLRGKHRLDDLPGRAGRPAPVLPGRRPAGRGVLRAPPGVPPSATPGAGRSRCSTGSASRSPTAASTTTRTSSPAACGSAP